MKSHFLYKYAFPLMAMLGLAIALILCSLLMVDEGRDLSALLQQHPLSHLALIMDGNRRWARKNGYKAWMGHKHGVTPVRIAIEFCLKYHIPFLTLYAFSLENFRRSSEELHYLFDVLAQEIEEKVFHELCNGKVRIYFAGDQSYFPEHLKASIERAKEETKDNTELTLTLLFCYGGQQEIIAAAKSLYEEMQAAGAQIDSITSDSFEKHLWTAHLPDADLIIRTGSMKRLSNFLLYKSAYSELLFLDCYWPDLSEKHLVQVVRQYADQRRTFGK